MRTLFACVALALAGGATAAQDRLVTVETRTGVTVSYWHMPREGATANLVLFTGGGGNIGMRDGEPRSPNFLVRNRARFADQGFNVAVIGRPSDVADMDDRFRTSARHLEDVAKVLADLHGRAPLPTWLIGTSMGTISVAAAAIASSHPSLAGIVLTSSITSYRMQGAVPRQNLDAIRVPVLVMHHQRDACWSCAPHEVPLILRGLDNAPVKALRMVAGGSDPRGDPCQPLHWHGFAGMDDEAVRLVTDWIRAPAR